MSTGKTLSLASAFNNSYCFIALQSCPLRNNFSVPYSLSFNLSSST